MIDLDFDQFKIAIMLIVSIYTFALWRSEPTIKMKLVEHR